MVSCTKDSVKETTNLASHLVVSEWVFKPKCRDTGIYKKKIPGNYLYLLLFILIIKVYYSFTLYFWQQINKSVGGAWLISSKFLIVVLCIFCLMFLIDAIKLKVEKKLQTCFLARLFKIKLVMFLFALGLLAATKTLLKRNETCTILTLHWYLFVYYDRIKYLNL